MYLLSYFRTESEALHLALSDDGLFWHPLRRNQPILTGTVGTKTLRDPFVFRARDGRFHLLATNGWRSDSIVHATSENLLDWSEQALVPLMRGVPNVRNGWAPECYLNREANVYQLIWSSSVTEPNGETDWNHRIWGAQTTDFVHYTPAALFFDPGHSVIDACVSWHEGTYWLAFKDEREANEGVTLQKAIRLGYSWQANGPWTLLPGFVTPPFTEGPSLFRYQGEWRLVFDHFTESYYGAIRSVDGLQWEAISPLPVFPDGVRHGSVLEIPDEIGEALQPPL